ncbi:MAG: hypothetical protein H7296_00510 [Bacteroidia bacterium]|nr:hypothetical protein [Bacteroidia bacterium]
MKSLEKTQDKPLECPISDSGRNKFKLWFKRVGLVGFFFFLFKGLIWLVVFYGGIEYIKEFWAK